MRNCVRVDKDRGQQLEYNLVCIEFSHAVCELTALIPFYMWLLEAMMVVLDYTPISTLLSMKMLSSSHSLGVKRM